MKILIPLLLGLTSCGTMGLRLPTITFPEVEKKVEKPEEDIEIRPEEITPKKLKLAARQELPICGEKAMDTDGDGYGWEYRGFSCVMTEDQMTQPPAPVPIPIPIPTPEPEPQPEPEEEPEIVGTGPKPEPDPNAVIACGTPAWQTILYRPGYVAQHNAWGNGGMNADKRDKTEQCIVTLNGKVSWTYNYLDRYDGNEFQVKAYPQVFYGFKHGAGTSGTKEQIGVPEQIKNLPDITINYEFSETGDAERNVAFESFFHPTNDEAGDLNDVTVQDFEMMVWVQKPSIRTGGTGEPIASAELIDGAYWDVYINSGLKQGYLAFVRTKPSSKGTLNWNKFIKWTQDYTQKNRCSPATCNLFPLWDHYYMGGIELGTEVFWGKGSFTLKQFDVEGF